MQSSRGCSGQWSTQWGAALRARVAHAGSLGLLALMMAACSLESSPGASSASGNTALSTRSQHLVNAPPTANDDTFTVPQDSADTVLDVLANDTSAPESNHAALTVANINNNYPNGGTVTLIDGQVHFTPSPGFHGVTNFAYIVADHDLMDVAGVTVTVTPTSPPPAAPVLLSPADGAVITDMFAPQGTAAPFTKVTLFIDGSMSGEVSSDESGHWSTTLPAAFPEGAHQWKATATDADGRTSPDSETRTFSINPIAAPVLQQPFDGEFVSWWPFRVSGTSAPFTTVSIFIDGNMWESPVQADASGDWSFFTYSDLSEGPHQVKASASDDVGHTSPESATHTFFIDRTPPPIPVVTAPADGSVIRSLPLTITGTADPGSTVMVRVDILTLGPTTPDSSGNWSILTSLVSGFTYHVHAYASDVAGNRSPDSPTHTFTVQLAPAEPDTTISSAPVCASGSRSATFDFGSNVPRVTFECSLDGAPFTACSTPMTYTDLSVGGHTLQVRARDAAGTVDSTPASYSWNAGLGCASTAVVSVRVR